MSTSMTLEADFERMLKAFLANDIKEALEISAWMIDAYPLRLSETLYWHACVQSRAGATDQVVACFEEALSNAIWWSPQKIKSEEEFIPCLTDPSFNAVCERMGALSDKAIKQSKPEVFRLNTGENRDIIVNLHWKDDTAPNYMTNFKEAYKTLDIEGVFFQSSQAESSKGFCWNDEERGLLEIEAQLAKEGLLSDNSLSKRIVAFSGTSQGGRLALKLAIKHGVDYIGVMPAIVDPSISINGNIKYSFILGTEDFFYKNVLSLHQNILASGGCSTLIEMPQIGHYFTSDFTGYYLKAHPIGFSKIELGSSLSEGTDGKTRELLNIIAAWHNATPILWMPEYQPSAQDLEETVNRLFQTPPEDLFLMVAFHGKEPVGFIWAYRQVARRDHVMIMSLYVEAKYRQQGISTALKLALEDWCHDNAVKAIETTVHYTNHKMIGLNQKMGYEAGMVTMKKRIAKGCTESEGQS